MFAAASTALTAIPASVTRRAVRYDCSRDVTGSIVTQPRSALNATATGPEGTPRLAAAIEGPASAFPRKAVCRVGTSTAPSGRTPIGGRYRFKIGKSNALIRAQVGNVFNNYGYGVGSSGFFVYNLPRRLSVTLTADI